MAWTTDGAIDCDIHPAIPGMKALLPYLDEAWAEQVVLRGIDRLDLVCDPPNTPLAGRPDWRPAQGRPGTDRTMLRAQALDGFGTRFAICNCIWGPVALHGEDLGAALCRAMNDWLAREWLDHDARLRASIVISLQSPELAVAEIERRAADRRFVQVLVLAMGELPLGRRCHWPIYAAAERHGLPIGIHAGSLNRHAPTAAGWPTSFLGDYVSNAQAFQAQLLSLMSEGVFDKFPGLKIVLGESGVTWLPSFMWRAVKTWRAMRSEVPWMMMSPAEILRDRVRLTLQPFDAPAGPGRLERLAELVGTDRMFLFSTDYPHWHFDGRDALPDGISPGLLQRVLVDNALDTYPRLREAPRVQEATA